MSEPTPRTLIQQVARSLHAGGAASSKKDEAKADKRSTDAQSSAATPATVSASRQRAAASGFSQPRPVTRRSPRTQSSAAQPRRSASRNDDATPRTLIMQAAGALSTEKHPSGNIQAQTQGAKRSASSVGGSDPTPRQLIQAAATHASTGRPVTQAAEPADGTFIGLPQGNESFAEHSMADLSALKFSQLSSMAPSASASFRTSVVQERASEDAANSQPRPKRVKRASGCIPRATIKGIFASFAKVPLSTRALAVLEDKLEQFLDSMCDDLIAFAQHAGRSTVEPSDVALLMKRQRLISEANDDALNALVRQHLPMEFVEQIIPVAAADNDVYPSSGRRSSKAAHRQAVAQADEEEDESSDSHDEDEAEANAGRRRR